MTDLKNMMSDSELDTVVGGKATSFIFPMNEKGNYRIIECNVNGDVDKIKKILAGGSVSSINLGMDYTDMTIRGNKLDTYIKMQQDKNVDIVRLE